MKNIYKSMAAFVLLMVCSFTAAQAQSVIFPQQQQPENAVGSYDGTTCTLSNKLFTATFKNDGKFLTFQGCPQMGLQAGTDLFKVTLGDGTVVTDKQMQLGKVELVTLTGDKSAVKGSHRFDGYELQANYTYKNMTFVWSAVLRDGSHYLRTKLDIITSADVAMKSLTPMMYKVDKSVGGELKTVGNTRGAILASDKLFAGLETPTGFNQVLNAEGNVISRFNPNRWETADFKDIPDNEVPNGVVGLKVLNKSLAGGYYEDLFSKIKANHVVAYAGKLRFNETGKYQVTFVYTTGTHKLNTIGVDLLDASGKVIASDYHVGLTGDDTYLNTYSFNVQQKGEYTVRYLVHIKTETVESIGQISYNKSVSRVFEEGLTSDIYAIQGLWKREATLFKEESNVQKQNMRWSVSSVVGMMAQGQARRSVLAYVERERAVPWRPMPVYNSWYELNIDDNNAKDPTQNMQTAQTAPILQAWKTNLYEKYGVGVKSFVWDDGWDNYQTWECHSAFDFTEPSATAKQMGAGTGVWLGPVGGYGKSGDTRRAYWAAGRGGMELSNPDYYKVFLAAVSRMVDNYNDNYFKLDGISAQVSSIGPDEDATGNEDAEAIIALESEIRKNHKEDIFFNTSVGTWASPFWFRYTDAVWRQEGDYGEAGNNSIDREKWITYRDRLVYQNFVQNSPLCPINTMMVHGFILSNRGQVSKNMDRAGIIREMRCAFASGNAMIELYCDNALLTQHNLWGDLAECIKWQQKNADVLPDIHWVGGNPWDGQNENIYGWASWNGKKATFALRNGDTQQKTFTTTLREALDIPDFVEKGATMTFMPSFQVQEALSGFTTGKPISIDETLTLILPASSAFVFDGVQDVAIDLNPAPEPQPEETTVEVKVTVTPENKYGTCILPFDATLPASLKAYSCNAVEGDLLILQEESSLTANTPYILFAEQGANEVFSGKVMLPYEQNVFVNGYLTGVLEATSVTADAHAYVLQNQGNGARFYLVDTPKTVPANKVYLTVPSNKVKVYRFGGDLTGIDGVLFEQSYYPVYDLAGRRVMKTIPGHIYIQNGKKLIAK